MDDRTVHAMTRLGVEIVRYGRAGKWYIEGHRDQPRVRITLADAVRLAQQDGATAFLGRPGGRSFDAKINKHKEG